MPAESSRILARKKLLINGDPSAYVDVPIITGIGFVDSADRGQESQYTIDNSDQSSRQGHSHTVSKSDDTSQTLVVERTDVMSVVDPVDRGQETHWTFNNNDPPPSIPDSIGDDPQHRKVHYVRYFQDNDDASNIWVDMEVIDECDFGDVVDRGQETIFSLSNPDIGDSVNDTEDPYNPTKATCDLTLPLLDYSGTSIDPPWRIDPFQNVVNVSSLRPTFSILLTAGLTQSADQTPFDSGVPITDPPPGPINGFANYADSIVWTFSSGVYFSGVGDGTGGPPTTPSPGANAQALSDWTFQYFPDFFGIQNTSSGAPLVIDGKTIVGYLDTLEIDVHLLLPALSDLGTYYFAGSIDWMGWTNAAAGGGPASSPTPNFTIMVSGSSFIVTDPHGHVSNWRAMGILDPAVNPSSPPPGFINYGNVYCKIA